METTPTTNPADAGEKTVTMTSTDFLTIRAQWKADGRPGPDSGHAYWDIEIPEAGPAECLTGLVPDEAVSAARRMAPAFRAASDANVAAMLRCGR